METTPSFIVHGPSSTSFVGPDATALFRAMTLHSAIKLYLATGMIPTRGVTISKMLVIATQITGKTYRRGAGQAAVDDLQVWIEAMKAAMPVC